MTDTIAVNFLEYAAAHRLALFPCAAGTKRPILKWKDGSTADPAAWAAWTAEGHNLAIDCAKSGLIMLDVDASKVSREQAWQAYHDLCVSWGLQAALAPSTQSARGGWHIPFQRPADLSPADLRGGGTLVKISDIRALATGEQDGEVVGFKNRGYCVAPGSHFEGLPYLLLPGAPTPHEAPAGLVEALRLPVVPRTNAPNVGIYDVEDIKKLYVWMLENDGITTDEEWYQAGMIAKIECGDAGLDVWSLICHNQYVDDKAMVRWNSFSSDARPSDATLGSLMKRAHALGWRGQVSKSNMFAGVASSIAAAGGNVVAELAKAVGATTHSAALIGQTWNTIAALGQPLLDTFLEATKNLPMRPGRATNYPALPANTMDTHPLFEAMNAAIERIVVMTETPKTFRQQSVWNVLKVLRWTHEPTYDALVGFIRASQCTLSSGELAKNNKGFEVAIVNEQRDGAGPRGFVPGAKNLPDPQVSDNVGIFLGMAGVRLQYDEFTQRTELSESEDTPFARVDQHHLDKYWYLAKSSNYGFHPAKDLFRTGWGLEARATRTYDSLRDRVDALALAWDGLPRLDNWLSRCVGVVPDLYHLTVGRNLIGGMVRRARYPGCVQAETVIFISPLQGTGKSTLCKILALESDWYLGKYKLGASEQNSLPLLAGKWVVEMSELAGLNKTDFEDVKTLLTSTKDEYVAKYEAIPTEHLRRCCFIGTSNLRQPLADPSGNRRFLPVHVVGSIDLNWLQANVEQLIGEAAARETAGESFAIPEEVWALTTAQQEAARNLSPVEEAITEWFDRPEPALYVLAADIRRALDMSGLHATARYGVFMENLGWRSMQAPNRGRDRIWIKGAAFTECISLEPAQSQANGRVEMRMRIKSPPV